MALTLGQFLRDHREARGLTVTELAAQLGCSKGLLSQYEGDNRVPSLRRKAQLAELLHVDLFEIEALDPTARVIRAGEWGFDLAVCILSRTVEGSELASRLAAHIVWGRVVDLPTRRRVEALAVQLANSGGLRPPAGRES